MMNKVDVFNKEYTYIKNSNYRENLKKILIGKNGNMIKKIGMDSRKDIEQLLGKKVYLDLRVKVISDWRDKEQFLNFY